MEDRREELCAALAAAVEAMPPSKVLEAVEILLIVPEEGTPGRIVGYLEPGARPVQIQVDEIVAARQILDLPETEQVLAVVVKIDHLASGGIENQRLPAHVRHLPRPRHEEAEFTAIATQPQPLAVA